MSNVNFPRSRDYTWHTSSVVLLFIDECSHFLGRVTHFVFIRDYRLSLIQDDLFYAWVKIRDYHREVFHPKEYSTNR